MKRKRFANLEVGRNCVFDWLRLVTDSIAGEDGRGGGLCMDSLSWSWMLLSRNAREGVGMRKVGNGIGTEGHV